MITTRGKRVRALAILAGLIFLWWLAGHLWWTGDHFCLDDMTACFNMKGGK